MLFCAAALGATPALSWAAPGVDALVAEQGQADRAAAAAQARIDQLDDETRKSLTRYRHAVAEAESYERYNQQLAAQVGAQREEIARLSRQLGEIEITARDILPLIQRMVDVLERFVALDLPFLPEERRRRVDGLKALLPRADVSVAEKYRRVMEAYQIEMEYGRTLEAYDGKLEMAGVERTVELLRVGRVALLYRTLDGAEVGYWNADTKAWVRDDGYARAVREALRVAKKQGAPDFVRVPVPAPRRPVEQGAP